MNRLVCTSMLLFVILAGHASAQTATTSGDSSRAIAGRVLDHNGQPIRYKHLNIHKVGGGPQGHRENYTERAGEFRFDGLASGVYQVSMVGGMGEAGNRFYRPGEFVTFRLKKGGVITGTVTDRTGKPIIAARVHVIRVRDENGRRIRSSIIPLLTQLERLTDDRGQYRFWGLAPGSYLVSAGGKPYYKTDRPGPLDESAPTYHPSAASVEAAVEVRFQDGQELTGIDIRHRGESGHTIRGYVSGQIPRVTVREGIAVMLTHAATGTLVEARPLVEVRPVESGENVPDFVFDIVADGEYYLTALYDRRSSLNSASLSRRVIVKGEDITGVELRLLPFGSAEGRLALETNSKPDCQPKSTARLVEAVLIFHGDKADPRLPRFTYLTTDVGDDLGLPDEEGGFASGPLRAGRYRVEARLPSKDWYISSIALPGSAQSGPADVGRDGITIRSGERVTGLTIAVGEGAASVRGRVALSQRTPTPAAVLRVHLIPAEPEQRDNVIKFAETDVESQGSFHLTNIAPGRYWLLVRSAGDVSGNSIRFLAWDSEARAKLVREAVAANNSIELKPCQHIVDRVLSYAPLATKALK